MVARALIAVAALAAAAQALTASVAHRGASAYYPENTLTAIRAADEFGSEGYEIDMRMTADNVLILMHDSTLTRTTNCSGTVTNVNYNGFVQYCVAGKVEPVPTVKMMLDYLTTSRMFCYFDIKCSGACIDELGRLLNSYPVDLSDRLYLGGQNQADVQRIREAAPRFMRSIVMSSLPADPANVDVQNFNINFSAVRGNPDFVARANANNQTVFSWTINNQNDMRTALSIPVNGVVTDYPDVFINIRDGGKASN